MRRISLHCASNRFYGEAIDAVGELEVRCTAKWCRRPGQETWHLFNLETGVCVDRHVPAIDRSEDRQGVREP